MRTFRLIALFSVFAASVILVLPLACFAADNGKANPQEKKEVKRLLKEEKAKQKVAEDAKKLAEAKKAAEARKAEEAKAAESARKAAEAIKVKEAKKVESASKIEVAKPSPAPVAARLNTAAASALIDRHISAKLAADKISPSPICTDEEFLRRVYLDIAGVIPTLEQARDFLDDITSDKRARLIDALLSNPNYGRKQADLWQAKMFPRDSNNRFVQREPFVEWLKGEFNKNVRWDEFVTKIVTATGNVETNPAVTYFFANRSVDKLTDTTAQHFLGIRLSCAQCHNHPFTPTKQTEYWGMAAFYSKVLMDKVGNANKGADNNKIGVREGSMLTKAKDFFPESTMKVNAKFLGGEEPKIDGGDPARPVLARWITSRNNPFFAKAMVNRTWASFFGNGIVDPVDDMIQKNKPSHPELLAELAAHFADTGFDVKQLIRVICNSQTYQRSARPNTDNKEDSQLFSHMNLKAMTPEQLYDSLTLVTGVVADDKKTGGKAPAAPKGQPSSNRDRFVTFFLAGAEETNIAEYEAGIPQALRLINSKATTTTNAVRTLAPSGSKPADVIEKIYLTALSRRPTGEEILRLTDYVSKVTTPAEAYGDILWAVLNSSEFTLIR